MHIINDNEKKYYLLYIIIDVCENGIDNNSKPKK